MRKFQSTRPHGARRGRFMLLLLYLLFQSTRPHGARPEAGYASSYVLKFQSTRPHGARQKSLLLGYPTGKVSIHAPAWGATFSSIVCFLIVPCFNPRARMGRDGRFGGGSIRNDSFNPRARMGRDRTPWRRVYNADGFQSTRPHGARLFAS